MLQHLSPYSAVVWPNGAQGICARADLHAGDKAMPGIIFAVMFAGR
jgi:hypothetical protein